MRVRPDTWFLDWFRKHKQNNRCIKLHYRLTSTFGFVPSFIMLTVPLNFLHDRLLTLPFPPFLPVYSLFVETYWGLDDIICLEIIWQSDCTRCLIVQKNIYFQIDSSPHHSRCQEVPHSNLMNSPPSPNIISLGSQGKAALGMIPCLLVHWAAFLIIEVSLLEDQYLRHWLTAHLVRRQVWGWLQGHTFFGK